MSNREGVADRVRKLLALAEGRANEHESAVAMERAQALILEHNLSVAELRSKGHRGDQVEVTYIHGATDLDLWLPLWTVTAGHNFCRVFRSLGEADTVVLIGTPANSMAVATMFSWVRPQVYTLLLRDGMPARPREYGPRQWKISWVGGVVSRLSARLAEQRRLYEADPVRGSGTALALRGEDALVEAWVAAHIDPINIKVVHTDYASLPAKLGFQAGGTVSIASRQLEGDQYVRP